MSDSDRAFEEWRKLFPLAEKPNTGHYATPFGRFEQGFIASREATLAEVREVLLTMKATADDCYTRRCGRGWFYESQAISKVAKSLNINLDE